LSRSQACAELGHELGVYLLGASAPADRKAVEDHLSSCAGCRDELADLAGLPALLGRVPPDDVEVLIRDGEAAPPPEQPLGALLSRIARRRRQRAVSMAAAAAAVGLVASAAALHGLAGPAAGPAAAGSAPAGAITVRGSNPANDTSAVVKYAPRPWGVQLYVQVSGIPAGTRCSFDVTDSDGRESAAGSWTVADGYEKTWYFASSSVPAAAIRGFVVTAGAQPIVDVQVPVGQPVVITGHR
jgi:Putative zinc-finger